MIRKQYPVGETLFAEGEPSDYACRILSGEVDIVKQNERETVSLGTAKAGEFVGELGVIQGSPRSATVRALSPVTVEVVSKDEFLKRISEDSELSFQLLSRLSSRLQHASQALLEAATTGGARSPARHPSSDTASPLPALRVLAGSHRLARVLPPEGVPVTTVPFVVGRVSMEGEMQLQRPVDLAVADVKPFRLSRAHFSIDYSIGTYVVRDMHSSLGTEVNGNALGDHFAADQSPLHSGDNVVVAGGKDSPCRFLLVLEGYTSSR